MTPAKKRKIGLFLMGMALASCSAVMTANAGYNLHDGGIMGVVLAMAFVIFTFGSCVLPNQMVQAFRSGRPISACFLAGVVALFVVGELAGELMVMTAIQGRSAQGAKVTNARWEDLDKSITNLEKQLATATEKLERQSKYESAASYEAKIKDADDLAAREASKERNGCKAKCDAAKALAADLRAKHAIAVERETKTEPEVKDLTAKLAAAKGERKGATMGYSESEGRTDLLAKVLSGDLSPSKGTISWTSIYFIVFMAGLFTFGSIGLVYASEQDWTPKPKTPRNSKLVGIARTIRRLWANVTGEVVEHHTVKTDPVAHDLVNGLAQLKQKYAA